MTYPIESPLKGISIYIYIYAHIGSPTSQPGGNKGTQPWEVARLVRVFGRMAIQELQLLLGEHEAHGLADGCKLREILF